MSIARRLISGNLATLSSMGFNIAAQVLVVPLFLHFWGAELYGLWLAVIAALGLATVLDMAHQDYVGFACMQLTDENREGRGAILSDAMPVIAIVGAAELALIAGLLSTPLAARMFEVPGSDPARATAPSIAFAILMLLWVVNKNYIGIVERVLVSLGYFSRAAWWGLAMTVQTALMPVAAAALGASLVGAAVAVALGTLALNAVIYVVFHRALRREGVQFRRPDLRRGFGRFVHSLGIAFSATVEYMQQTGFRLLLLPFLGAAQLAAFATHRTVANVAQQGMNTLIYPTQPELMRMATRRDGPRFAMLLMLMMLVVTALLCPAFVMLQMVVGRLFALWTLGTIAFDAQAFALLSAAVLAFGVVQPSRAIIRGNNLIRTQVAISCASALVLGLASLLMIPYFGIRGAAGALALGEVTRTVIGMAVAARWCRAADLSYPVIASTWAVAIVAFTAGTIFVMALLPAAHVLILLVYLPAWLVAHLAIWKSLPSSSRTSLVARLRGITSRFSVHRA